MESDRFDVPRCQANARRYFGGGCGIELTTNCVKRECWAIKAGEFLPLLNRGMPSPPPPQHADAVGFCFCVELLECAARAGS
jgi:hypothetical protein